MIHVWNWLKDNDAPNWFTLAFSLIAWPAFLYWWNRRKRQSIPGLEISLQQGQTSIETSTGIQQFNAVEFIFTNRTGCVVYISGARLRECQKRFQIPLAAIRDISGWHELKFQKDSTPNLSDHERILQTYDRVMTNIAASTPMPQAFYNYQPKRVPRWLRYPKYFRLQYIVMIGEMRYFVETVY